MASYLVPMTEPGVTFAKDDAASQLSNIRGPTWTDYDEIIDYINRCPVHCVLDRRSLRRMTATAIVMFGDTRRNAGRRAVAEKLAQIAVVGATALAALLGSNAGSSP